MAWGVLPIRATSGHNGGTGGTDPPARAKSAVADYAENLDRKAWIDRVQLYGGDSEPVMRHEDDSLDGFIRTISGGKIDGRRGLWQL